VIPVAGARCAGRAGVVPAAAPSARVTLGVMRRLLANVVALLCACLLPAQEAGPSCKLCVHRGTTPCGKHGKLLEVEKGPVAQLCSAVAECKACSGALAIDCRHCANAPAETDLAARQRLAQEWLQGRRKAVDAVAAREPYAHLKTPHFDLACGLKPATIGRDKLDQHARLHLYGERLEALHAKFLATFELAESDLPDRMTVALSEEGKDQQVLGPRLTGLGPAGAIGLKLMGPEYVYTVYHDRRSLPDDEALHRAVVHNVAHLLLSQMRTAQWLGNRGHGWLDEGVPHWFEETVVGKCTNFCFEEILLQTPASFKGGKWRPAVRKIVDEGKAPPFATFAAKNSDQLTFVEHAFSFALVDFLLQRHGGAKFRDFLRLVKKDVPTRDALQQAFGLNPLSIDAPFHAWVKDTYSPLPN
jgi:hypothetical protein